MCLTVGSAFTGIGVGDKGLEDAGMRIDWQIEIDERHCWSVLKRHWPAVRRYGDLLEVDPDELEPVDLVIGGDPCPIRSRARALQKTRSPDMSGWFLLLVACVKPAWVLRENVPAPDVVDFQRGLEVLGYRTLLLRINSGAFVAQSREREYIVGCPPARWHRARQFFSIAARDSRFGQARNSPTTRAQCLTTHAWRYDSRDNLVYEAGRGIRVLTPVERELLQGLPPGWTDGLSDTQRAAVLGRAMTRDVIEWTGRRILEAEATTTCGDVR